MRIAMVVGCVLLTSAAPALGCDEFGAESTGWLREMSEEGTSFLGASAEESSMIATRLVGAGLAAVALVVLTFRAMIRVPRHRPSRPVELEPVGPSVMPMFIGAEDLRIRVDGGHEGPGPAGIGRDEAPVGVV